MEIDRGDPVVSVRLEMSPELANPAPAFEVIVGVFALLKGNDLGKVATQERKSSSGADYADSHIVFVEDKDIAVQT